jgi:MFS family permease
MLGVALGGWLADAMRRRATAGRLAFAMVAALAPIPFALWLLAAETAAIAYVVNVPLTLLTPMWIGAGASTMQDLVLPRMRALATAAYTLVVTFIGLALGPWVIGRLSDALGDLADAMRWALLANVGACLCLAVARRHLAHDERSLVARARAAGEPG